MSDTQTGQLRPADDFRPEQEFLQKRIAEIEKDMGRLAATQGRSIPLTQPLDTLDRARELVAELDKQVLIRPLGDAVAGRLEWLDQAQARRDNGSDASTPNLDKIELDRRILGDIIAEWESLQ